MTDINLIRNFSIIAHIDHGKSTLADRLIQECKGLAEREMKEQVLDNMEIERERGITIKAQTVRLLYKHSDNKTYTLNLMDTPGHVDFAYEVSRSLSACEGSLLVVDSSQGVEAQTLANVYQAIDVNHEIVTVLNKIDLPASEPVRIRKQIEDVIGLPGEDGIEVSAKTGQGIKEVLSSLIEKLAPPKGNPDAPLQALLIDSWYDPYLGVLTLVRVVNGSLKKGQKIRFMSTKVSHTIEKLGIFTPKIINVDELGLMYDVRENRVVFPVVHQGKMVDATGRTLSNRLPKWKRYGKSTLPFSFGCGKVAVVVEDCVSAAVVGNDAFVGVAVLGTSLSEGHKRYLSQFSTAIIALDPDALPKTLAFAKELRGHVSNVKVLRLTDDLKYRNKMDMDNLIEIGDTDGIITG